MLLYYALAYPHLTYSVVLWCNAPSIYLHKVLVAQNRLMRNIVGHYSASASAAYNDLKILNISLIYEHQCLCSMFKINNNASPTLLIESIKSNQIQHSYNTRRKHDTRTPFCSLSIAQKSFSFQGPVFWNQIPNDIKTLNCTVQSF